MSKYTARKYGSRYSYRTFWIKKVGPQCWETFENQHNNERPHFIGPTLKSVKEKIDRFIDFPQPKPLPVEEIPNTPFKQIKWPPEKE